MVKRRWSLRSWGRRFSFSAFLSTPSSALILRYTQLYVRHALICLLRCLRRDLDLQMVSVGPAFKGIKMIPPGPHFVYYSSSTRFCLLSKQALCGNLNAWILNLFVFFLTCRDGNDFSPITGFFVHSGSSQVSNQCHFFHS